MVGKLLLAALIAITTLVTGCAATPPPAAQPEPQPPAVATASDYFPYKPGVMADFEGKGNEFAPFTLQVLHQENNLVEWRRITGGTTLAEVHKVEPTQVTLIYREGEAYDQNKRIGLPSNIGQVILKNPITKGTTWTSETITFTIISTSEQVDAVGKTLTDVVVVEQKHEHSMIRQYFHKTYGLVLTVFQSHEVPDTIESRLKTITGL